MKQNAQYTTPIPSRWVGPVRLIGDVINEEEVSVPLATYEKPLWPSTDRGARVSRHCNGIRCTVVDERMTRSITLRASNAQVAKNASNSILERKDELQTIVASTSRFTRLDRLRSRIVGNLLYLRFECVTGDAAGHNMVTAAADALQTWLLQQYPQLQYSSISGNYCTDKKVSSVNSILAVSYTHLTLPTICSV